MTLQPDARELSAEERQARAKKCFDIEKRIKDNLATGREAMWELAKNLYEFNAENGWSALGHETQQEWLAQPEIGMSRRQFFNIIRRHRELVVHRHVPLARLTKLDPSKIDIVMPTIEDNKAPVAKVLDDVESLGARDLREIYIGGNGASEPAPEGGADSVDGAEPDTIDGDAYDVPEESIERPAGPTERLSSAFAAVDAWVEQSDDLKEQEVQEAWATVLELHPVFAAATQMGAYLDGTEESVRDQMRMAWSRLRALLDLIS